MSKDVKGMNYISARQSITYLMKKHQLDDIALLQETRINYAGKEIHEDFTFYFSSVIEEDEHRKSVDSKLEDLAQRVKRKTITEEEILNISAEKLGVGIVSEVQWAQLGHSDINQAYENCPGKRPQTLSTQNAMKRDKI